jgi:hypothetical protein
MATKKVQGGTDWLEQQIEIIRTAERKRQQENQVKRHRADMLKAKAHIFLADAGQETKKVVDILNREFKDDQKRQLTVETLPNAIAVGGLGSRVTATLQPGGVIRFTTESGHAHVHTREHTIELAVDENELLYCQQAESRGPGAVTQALLRPFLSAFREEV